MKIGDREYVIVQRAGAGWCLSSFVISYALNHSFWWAVFHTLLGWMYVAYAFCCRGHEVLPALARLFA